MWAVNVITLFLLQFCETCLFEMLQIPPHASVKTFFFFTIHGRFFNLHPAYFLFAISVCQQQPRAIHMATVFVWGPLKTADSASISAAHHQLLMKQNGSSSCTTFPRCWIDTVLTVKKCSVQGMARAHGRQITLLETWAQRRRWGMTEGGADTPAAAAEWPSISSVNLNPLWR